MIEPVILEGYFYTEAQEGGYAEDATFFITNEQQPGYDTAEHNLARWVQSHFMLKHDYERSPKVRVTIEVIDRTASST